MTDDRTRTTPVPNDSPDSRPMTANCVTANGRETTIPLPCPLDQFLRDQGLPPRSVVVELNGEAVAPSQFPSVQLHAGDRLEIVKIVAGG